MCRAIVFGTYLHGPVRHRHADRGAGGLALPPEGHRPLRRGPHPDGRVPPPAVRHPGRRRARGAGYGRGVCRDGNGGGAEWNRDFCICTGATERKDHRRYGSCAPCAGVREAGGHRPVLKGGNSGEIPLLAQLARKIYRGQGRAEIRLSDDAGGKGRDQELQNQNLAAAMAKPADLLILDEAGERRRAGYGGRQAIKGRSGAACWV